jgi:hypothetical protein
MAPGPPPPYVPYSPYPGHRPQLPNEGKAVTSLVLGILSIFCFGALSGIPAIVLGAMSRRAISRSGHALGGGGMATAGIITGGIGSALSMLSLAMFVIGMMNVRSAISRSTAVPTTTAGPTTYGAVEVVEVVRGAPLQGQLVAMRRDAVADGKTLLVETEARWCGETCTAVTHSLHDARMQRALEDVRIVHVDVDEFAGELPALKMSSPAVPYFYLLDASAIASDALSADEWDDNTPSNMAPVLQAFVRGMPRNAGEHDGGRARDGGVRAPRLHTPKKPGTSVAL